ncbi:MAG: hypothetical protein H7141_11085 [Burkholderiales bacterium]|nr:hypothetical protein [Bacteroidia bacterium]
MSGINWDDIEALETIANQCIYKGKEVGQARAALKAIYGYNVIYSDELDDKCNETKKEDTEK